MKSPLFNLSEKALLEVSQGRKKKSLWASFSSFESYKDARATLAVLLKKVDQLSPYQLFHHVLTTLKGRQKFRARLSDECDDVLDEFLNLAFDFSHEKPNGLQGFVEYCQSSNPDIKRDFSRANLKAVRIMTIHGAKGLQAPIVFLPDTTRIPAQYPMLLWDQGENDRLTPVWRTPSTLPCGKTEAIKEQEKSQQMAEYYRLLYVALTRAEDELVIAGWETTRETSDECWYHIVEPTLRQKGFQQHDDSYLYECPQQRQIPVKNVLAIGSRAVETPAWLFQSPPGEIGEAEPLSPSAFFSDKTQKETETKETFSLLETEGLDPYVEGSYVHKLLEILPTLIQDQWELVAQNQALSFSISDWLPPFEAVKKLLTHQDFQGVFGENSYAEVDVSGGIQGQKFNGQIDRLIIENKKITIIDFKSNKASPQSLDEVPESYIGQLKIYKELIQKIYPAHEVSCELIWVRPALRMPVPSSFLDAFSL